MKAEPTSMGNSAHRLRRNVTVGSRRTSVSLESHVWEGLREICQREAICLDTLCTEVYRQRQRSSMASALRVFLLLYFRSLAETRERQQGDGDDGDKEDRSAAFGATLEVLGIAERSAGFARPAVTS